MCLRDDFRFFTPLCYVQNDRMSTLPSKSGGRELDGRRWDEMPNQAINAQEVGVAGARY